MLSQIPFLLILSVIFVVLVVALFLLRRRRRKSAFRLERDSCGLWRYHRDTQFQRRAAFGKVRKGEGFEADQASKEKRLPVVVLRFDGDLRGKQHEQFGSFVDEVEVNKEEISEVVVRIESPGGMVAPYGHLFSQMERIRRIGLPLTACVDVVAASGGYLMSLPATKILAAPFAHVGSIGVAAFVPNLRGFLLKQHIAPRTFTAGRWKRTISLTDDATPEEISHFQSQLESIHGVFCDAVRRYRPNAKLEQVSTGDHWTAQESLQLELGLVDEIMTSEEYLLKKNESFDLIELGRKRSFFEESFGGVGMWLLDSIEMRLRRFLGEVHA